MSDGLIFSGKGRKTTPDQVQLGEDAQKVAAPFNVLFDYIHSSLTTYNSQTAQTQDKAFIEKGGDLVLNFCQTVVMEEQKVAGQNSATDNPPSIP